MGIMFEVLVGLGLGFGLGLGLEPGLGLDLRFGLGLKSGFVLRVRIGVRAPELLYRWGSLNFNIIYGVLRNVHIFFAFNCKIVHFNVFHRNDMHFTQCKNPTLPRLYADVLQVGFKPDLASLPNHCTTTALPLSPL